MGIKLTIAATLCVAALAVRGDVEIRRGVEWVPVRYLRDIAPGSAMDFSGMGLQDAPAGKHGWLRNVGGHFEFEGRPGVRQVFYGVNLSNSANYPDHATADRLVERLVRLGYNSVRIHHHDGAWVEALREANDDIDRLDYLLSRCFEAGLYATTDLYVSRDVPWPREYYRCSAGHDDAVWADWSAFAQNFLEHVNPYTGRAYKDEPGMPLLSLVNEGAMTMHWASLRELPEITARWRKWLDGRRAADARRYAAVPDNPAGTNTDAWKGPWSAEVYEFAAQEERANFIRERDLVRAIGAKALLTSVNFYALKEPFRELRAELFDYADDHFYIDHPNGVDGGPQFGEVRTSCPMKNPILGLQHEIVAGAAARTQGLPLVASEWNWCAPSRYRNLAGLVVGVASAVLDRDGMWRFDYSSHSDTIVRDWHITPFQMACDPVSLVSDRAIVCLFLRGDAERIAGGVATTADATAETTRQAGFDAETGTLAVETARTCGIWGGPGTNRSAGPLSARIEGSPAAVWASAIDDATTLAGASRILLAHLTDVLNEGARFSGAGTNVWESAGNPPWVYLARTGRADLSLRLDNADTMRVWALALDGSRKTPVASEARDGILRFTADVKANPSDATFLYEIVKEQQ